MYGPLVNQFIYILGCVSAYAKTEATATRNDKENRDAGTKSKQEVVTATTICFHWKSCNVKRHSQHFSTSE